MRFNLSRGAARGVAAFAAALLPMALLTGPGVRAAAAKDCDGAVSCACGDTLVGSRTLASTDPVVNPKEPCEGNGLIIRGSGLTLDCNGLTIAGSGRHYGIWLIGDSNSVLNCTIKEFATGVRAGGIGENTIAGNTIRDVKWGIVAARRDPEEEGGGNTVSGNTVINARQVGISASGNENEIVGDDATTGNSVYDSNVGFSIRGASYTVSFAKALITRNAEPDVGKVGFRLRGSDATVDDCSATGFQLGFFVSTRSPMPDADFTGMSLTDNDAEGNGRHGFYGAVYGTSFDTNAAAANGRSGMLLHGGSESFPNSYTSNQAIGNGEYGIWILGLWNDGAEGGGNLGTGNAGAIQCRIGGIDCQ